MDVAGQNSSKAERYISLLEGEELQYIQDCYARVARLFVVCADGKGKCITRYSGNKKELEFIKEKIPQSYYDSLVEQLIHNPYEEQMIADTNYPCVKMVGTAIAVENKSLVLWCGYAVLSDVELPKEDKEKWEQIQTKITSEELSSRMELSRVLVRKMFSETFLVLNAREEAKRSRLAEMKMKEELRKNQTMTEIVKNLESSDDFDLIVRKIIEFTADYLKVEAGNLFKINKKEKCFEVACCQTSCEEKNSFKDGMKIPFEEWALKNERPVFISAGMQLPSFSRKKFDEYGIQVIAALPVYVNDEVSMYMNFMEYTMERVWSLADIQFLGDVTKIVQSILSKHIAKNSLDSSYAALSKILDNVGSGILVTDKATDEILFTNQIVDKIFGEELSKGVLCEELRNGKKINYNSRYMEYYAEKLKRWYDLHYTELIWVDGREALLCAMYDVTDKRNYQKKIEQQANNDFLTGLYNRMRCEKDLKKHILRVKENNGNGALFFLDLDNFKNINDGLGHQYGDVLLREISNQLRTIPEISKTCYRMGGDEFVIILPEEHYHKKEEIRNKLMGIFNKPWYLKGADYFCTVSVGIVEFPRDGIEANDLIKKADIAMYEAKKDGKNRAHDYTEESGSFSLKRFDMEKNMRDSSLEGYRDFVVYYQPVMDMKKGQEPQCKGAEALIRWKHSTMGMVSPGEFIPMAEYLGLINPIGSYVLKQACKACRNWNELGHPDYKVNVNLSVVQLLQSDIVDIIKGIMEETGINPQNLVLEVTESLAINDMNRMKQVLSEIRKLGIGIALDDFGTGYSSLNHIKEIPLDIVKIDRTFVNDIESNDYAKAFLKMISELAITLGLHVCVEGIERREQLSVMKEMEVKYLQGFYFDKAIPLEEFEARYIFGTGGIK